MKVGLRAAPGRTMLFFCHTACVTSGMTLRCSYLRTPACSTTCLGAQILRGRKHREGIAVPEKVHSVFLPFQFCDWSTHQILVHLALVLIFSRSANRVAILTTSVDTREHWLASLSLSSDTC